MTTIASSLATFGYAPVLAFTRRDQPVDARRRMTAPAQLDEVRARFSAAPDSQLAQAARVALRPAGRAGDGAPAARADGARVYPNLGVVYGTVDRDGLAALRASPDVVRVTIAPQLSLIRPIASTAGTPRAGTSWGIEALGIPELWAAGLTGRGVRVAHLDTGVDAGHPALADAVAAFTEFDHGGLEVPGATARDSDLRDGHGTHTAGTIAGRPVRRRRVGVAPGAALYSSMVVEGGDVIARILAGMNWAVGEGVRVLSVSLGIRGYVGDFLGLIQVLRDSGVLPVVAVGNEGPGTSRSPGNYPRVLSVGYYTPQQTVADSSSSQRFPRRSQPLVPDVVAPGEGVVSARAGGGWRTLSGSSMAVPHLAGLAALLLEARPTATVAQLERAMLASAQLGALAPDRANRGAVHGPRALAALPLSRPRP